MLDRLAGSFAGAALAQTIGVDRSFTLPQVIADHTIAPARAGYLEVLLGLLERTGRAERNGVEWRLIGGDPSPAPDTAWREALARHPAHLPSLQLIARCGEAIQAMLRDQIDPREALPAPAGLDALDHLHDSHPL